MTKSLTIQQSTNLVPASLDALISSHEGEGLSSDASDNKVPLVYLLQPLSPQVNKNDAKYVKGAEPGSVWLRNAPPDHEIVDGDEGFLFQPCAFDKNWVEWTPRSSGGGRGEVFSDRPAEAKQVPDAENPRKKRWMLPNGNEVIETRYHIGYVLTENGLELPYVIPMTGSNHTVSRDWMYSMNTHRSESGNRPPSYAGIYRLKTFYMSSGEFNWYQWRVELDSWVNAAGFERGSILHDSFNAGEKVADDDSTATESSNSF